MCLAPYQLAGCLRAYGVEAAVHEITPDNFEDDAHVDALVDQECVGFTCNTFTYAFLLPVLRKLKKAAPHLPTVMGGIHTLRSYTEILAREPVDYIVPGEGDWLFPEIVLRVRRGHSMEDLDGIAFRRPQGDIVHTPQRRSFLPKELPLAAYDLLPKIPRILVFESSRGCPFRCTFCSIDMSSKWSAWSPDIVIDRFDASVAMLPKAGVLRNIMFGDDNFATNQNRAAAILDGIHARYPDLILSFETRAREVQRDPKLLRMCVENGIRTSFLFGIECGYDEGLAKINKRLTVDEVRRSAALVAEYGLQAGAVFSYIVGFPWEDRVQRMQTLTLADELYETYGVKSTCFYWLPIPSAMTDQYRQDIDYSRPFWWRDIQINMNNIVDDDEAALMAKVNANGNFSDTRIDETGRPDPSQATGRSPRELPART